VEGVPGCGKPLALHGAVVEPVLASRASVLAAHAERQGHQSYSAHSWMMVNSHQPLVRLSWAKRVGRREPPGSSVRRRAGSQSKPGCSSLKCGLQTSTRRISGWWVCCGRTLKAERRWARGCMMSAIDLARLGPRDPLTGVSRGRPRERVCDTFAQRYDLAKHVGLGFVLGFPFLVPKDQALILSTAEGVLARRAPQP